jgi:hypothetical protein
VVLVAGVCSEMGMQHCCLDLRGSSVGLSGAAAANMGRNGFEVGWACKSAVTAVQHFPFADWSCLCMS